MSSIYTSYPGDQLDVPTALAFLFFFGFAFVGVVSLVGWISSLYRNRTKRGPASYPEQLPEWVHIALANGAEGGVPEEELTAILHIQARNECVLDDATWQRCITIAIEREEAGSRFSEELPENVGLHPGMWEATTYQEVLRLANGIFDQEVEG